MTELIKIESRGGVETVDARELHEKLQVGTRFNDWIKVRIEKYGFMEGQDYTKVTGKIVTPGGAQEGVNYYICLDMAKELAMVENNDQGRIIRRYFIDIENKMRNLGGQFIQTANDYGKIEASLAISFNLLRPSESSKVTIMRRVYEANGLETLALPDYTPGEVKKSATALLRELNVSPKLSAIEFNGLMSREDLLVKESRQSTKRGTVYYWTLTERGQEFGENMVSDRNPRETQPMYYASKFPELLGILGFRVD